MSTNRFTIREVSHQTGLSPDTLRYYEKIELLPRVQRNRSGRREYSDQDLSRLRFIQRAQKMNFSLAEIADLLDMRNNPLQARNEIRLLTRKKLEQVEEHLQVLTTLRDELTLLLNLCRGSEDGCPIIEGLEEERK